MNSAKKTRSKRRRRQTGKWVVAVLILLCVVTLGAAVYFWTPSKSKPVSSIPEESATFRAFTDHYLKIMANLNSSGTKTKMAAQLNSGFNQTDLFNWEQSRLTFAQDPTAWLEDPVNILNSGRGICVQWSIVYVSACLALGYQSRLVVSADTTNWQFIHVWAEDYFNGTWIHVDPSDKVWNNPLRYQSWDWGRGIGSDVRIYAFEDGRFEDVTANYGPH
jgi:hypothetical protein